MNAITTATPTRTRAIGPVLQPQSFQELVRFAEMAAGSDLMPKDYKGKPGNIMLAVQMGSELGLSPMQAIQNIAVINGRPSVWGDAMPGLCKQSPVCDDIEERFEGEGDKLTAICIAKRVGKKPVEARFSVEEAKKAELWNKDIWKKYPKRMLQMRARGFALRDAFPDVLKGLISAEEAMDMPPDDFRGTTVTTTAEPAPAPAAPPPSPIDTIRARLAACNDTECVTRVGDAWRKTVEKARDAGRPFSEVMVEDVTAMLADAYAQFVDGGAGDAGEPVDADEMPA